MKPRVCVLGFGVSALTTSIRLLEAGYDVHICAERRPHETTSALAAAVFLPVMASPPERTLAWSTRSYAVFAELANDLKSSIELIEGIELWRHPVPEPWWKNAVRNFAHCPRADLPKGYRQAFIFTVPLIPMPTYLAYLFDRFVAGGGTHEERSFRSWEEALACESVVVNCLGLGSYQLLNDREMTPIRGQIVRVRNQGLRRFILDEEHPLGLTYIIPRPQLGDVILGGTAEPGRWDTTPDPAVADAIISRCAELEPCLAGATILDNRVGLRPGRSTVRLERQEVQNCTCVHNYGHGGAGITMSWGCAEEVVLLLNGAVSKHFA